VASDGQELIVRKCRQLDAADRLVVTSGNVFAESLALPQSPIGLPEA